MPDYLHFKPVVHIHRYTSYLERTGGNMYSKCDLGKTLEHLNGMCCPDSKVIHTVQGTGGYTGRPCEGKGNRVDWPILVKMSFSTRSQHRCSHMLSVQLPLNTDSSTETVYLTLCLHRHCLFFPDWFTAQISFFVRLFTVFCNVANIWPQSAPSHPPELTHMCQTTTPKI